MSRFSLKLSNFSIIFHCQKLLRSGHVWPPYPRCLPRCLLPDLRDCLTDNPAVVSDINHQGGLHSRPLYKLAHQILVWSQDRFLSLRAIYIPWYLNVGADVLSRQRLRPGEWMVYPRWRSRYGECLVWLRWTFL